jgi:hypothetical protein
MLLGFVPFVAFAVAANIWGAMPGLTIGAALSAALLVKDLLRRQQPKILEIGTFLMFAGLLVWAKLFPLPLTVLTVRLRVDVRTSPDRSHFSGDRQALHVAICA